LPTSPWAHINTRLPKAPFGYLKFLAPPAGRRQPVDLVPS
jgi:hypothetical protein